MSKKVHISTDRRCKLNITRNSKNAMAYRLPEVKFCGTHNLNQSRTPNWSFWKVRECRYIDIRLWLPSVRQGNVVLRTIGGYNFAAEYHHFRDESHCRVSLVFHIEFNFRFWLLRIRHLYACFQSCCV